MFERYTDRARRSVVLAQEHARMLHHAEIDVDHMLLGLAAEGGGVAFQALAALSMGEDALRAAVMACKPPSITPTAGHLPFTRELKRALELGLRESLKLSNNFTGTEHLLLGLMRDCEDRAGSPCAAVLKQCGTTPQEVSGQVMVLLRGRDPVAAPSPAACPVDVQSIAGQLDEIIAIAQAVKRDIGKAGAPSVDRLGAGEDDG